MGIPMDAASRYDRRMTPLTRLVDAAPEESWAQPSPCAGWTAADVLQHLIDTQRDFMLKAGADMPDPTPDVMKGAALAWRTHAEAVARGLADASVGERPHQTMTGPSTVGDVMDLFYGFDMVVHRWDIARATGQETTFSEAELDAVETALEGFGEHLYGDGVCAPAVELGPDATRQDRVLARTGRDPR